ncbi:MAG: hypothetical protein SF029_16715, partial [bacterium]|nr:hypothetical protein [bacterium]
MSPHLIWQQRLDAFLDAYIIPLRNSLDAASAAPLNIPDPTKKLLFTTVVAFQEFAETHFDFFNHGFFPPTGTDGHIQTPAFSPMHVLSQVLARISQDVHLMQQMTLQRVINVIPDPMRTFLDQTDNLAARTLKLAVDRQWVHADSYILTFYERMLSARVVPFVRLAWIGIPLTAFKARRDLLAVPHEIGHYVYANGKIPLNGTPIYVWQWLQQVQAEQEFKDYPWLAEWAEEIFADIYGCLVAGDAIALTSQLIAEQSSRGPQGAVAADAELLPSHLFHNNGHHPMPYFRPLVYIRTLERLGTAGSAELRKRWERKQLSYSG